MSLREGETILNGKYHILELIGGGAFARVWKAEEPGFGHRLVAIKELKREQFSAQELDDFERRFQREVELSAALSKANVPNVVRAITLERLEETGEKLLVLEYAPGQSLAHLMAQHPQGLPIEQAMQLTLQICDALAGFHALSTGPVHRDLKPSNILLTETGEARLSDFGLAQLAGESGRSLGAGGAHPGTPLYMAPEQERGVGVLQPAADIFALGCVLFEMLTGKPYKHQPPGTPANSLRLEVLAWLDDILAKALAENHWERYQSAEDMRSALAGRGAAEELPRRPRPARPAERPRGGIRYTRDQVIIQGQGISISPPAARFTVFQESTSQQPILPKVKEELEYPIHVGDGARVEDCVHSPHSLIVGDGVILSKPIYGREEVRIGEDCELASHVVCSGPVWIGNRTKISGCLLASRGPIEIGDDCEMAGIWAGGNLTVGAHAKIEFIETSGDVVLDSCRDVGQVRARNVRVDSGRHVGHILASGDLTLGTGVIVDTIRVGGRLEINPPLEIRLMDTLVVRNALPDQAFPFRMKDQIVTQDNAFIWDGKQLLAFRGGQTAAPGSLMVVTLCLNHSLHRAIQAAMRTELSIPR